MISRNILFILIIFLPLGLFAQHLSFKGIPIDGEISSFQKKLVSQGFTYNSVGSKYAPAGERIFRGKYNGHNASLSVFYNRKTNLVYEVELSIESENIDVIQNELNKTRKIIEKQYAYFPEHDTDDDRSLHYRYHILPHSTQTKPIGTIHVIPTYSYLFDDVGNIVKTLYVLQINYEDKINASSLTPSVTKPDIRDRNYYANDPEKFFKLLVWANELKKGGDIDHEIDFLKNALNWYKHDCVPPGAEISEQQIEEEILAAQSRVVCTVPTWSNKIANVYKCPDDSPSGFYYIYPVNMGFYKIYPSELKSHISNMEKAWELFMEKIIETKDKKLSEYWNEDSDFTFPILFGEETLRGKYGWGNIQWENANAFIEFGKAKDGIYMTINNKSKSYMPRMLFSNPFELEQYIKKWRALLN